PVMARVAAKASAAVKKILMVRPTHFEVRYAINPWMDPVSKPVNRELAMTQWNTLKETIEEVGGVVQIMESENAPDWPDIVFAANAATVRGNKAYLANFLHPERKGEREFYKAWFEANGFETCGRTDIAFEGAGDALWCGKNYSRLFAGVGPRTDIRALPDLAKQLDDESGFKVIGCKLIDPRFYHIDVAFCPLSDELALWFPGAFDPVTQHNMKNEGVELVPVTAEDAGFFSCNAVVVGKNVIMNHTTTRVAKTIEKIGYNPIFIDMGEFIKAGGSSKCCTLQI
ncbi:hypothetical protein PENTCL1PPCAC_28347, partial [Pristionchus entomophagus]